MFLRCPFDWKGIILENSKFRNVSQITQHALTTGISFVVEEKRLLQYSPCRQHLPELHEELLNVKDEERFSSELVFDNTHASCNHIFMLNK